MTQQKTDDDPSFQQVRISPEVLQVLALSASELLDLCIEQLSWVPKLREIIDEHLEGGKREVLAAFASQIFDKTEDDLNEKANRLQEALNQVRRLEEDSTSSSASTRTNGMGEV